MRSEWVSIDLLHMGYHHWDGEVAELEEML
jgi:hypothetical protein